jgi:hypothetical protein
MIFFVDGKDRATSADVCVTLEGPDAAAVRLLAAQRGIAVTSIEPAGGPPDPQTFTDRRLPGGAPAYLPGRFVPRAPSHAGRWPDRDAQFFADAPELIGPIRSADSTLLDGQRPLQPIVRITMAAIPALISLALLCIAIFGWSAPHLSPRLLLVASLVAAGLAAAIAWMTRFRRYCTYVGEHGVARYSTAAPPAVHRAQVVPFASAAELRTLIHRHYSGAVCIGTEYDFVFLCPKGRPLMRMFGECRHAADGSHPPDERLLHFALAAEAAWTRHLMRQALLALRETGHVDFRVNATDRIRLAQNRISFFFAGAQWTWSAGEIGSFHLRDGWLRISHRDATALRGHVRFPHARLSNAALFIHLLERLCQITPRR